MNNPDFIAKLKSLEACKDAVEWVGDKDFKTAWNDCERADWMLWLICKMEIGTKQERIHATCDCAATALQCLPKGEDRPKNAILAARQYADEPTQENLERLNTAGAAAWAAAWAVAGDAAWAVARAAAGDTAAGDAAHRKMCVLIRERIKIEEFINASKL